MVYQTDANYEYRSIGPRETHGGC